MSTDSATQSGQKSMSILFQLDILEGLDTLIDFDDIFGKPGELLK
jgi:hypothetical protein